MTGATDDLLLRDGLPAEFRYLEAGCPRGEWAERDIHATARHWLEVHGWFRGMLGGLGELGGEWRNGRLDGPGLQRAIMPRLRQFLSNLEGHHHIESDSYFPALAALEPRMKPGFALLDRDHEAVHLLLAGMAEAANGFNRTLHESGDGRAHADALADAIEAARGPIGRHLSDEEEIIVPVLTLRGDPFG